MSKIGWLGLAAVLWLVGSCGAGAVERKSDITLTPSAMTFSGPADSVVPGSIIGSQWSSTTTVSEVFWCGILLYQCGESTMAPGAGAVNSGLSVSVDGIDYVVFETGVPGIGFILGMKDPNATSWVPLQEGVTQTYPVDGTNSSTSSLGWSAKVTFVKTNTTLKSGVYTIPSITAATLTAYSGSASATASVIISSTTVTVTATGCVVGTANASVSLGRVDMHSLPAEGSTSTPGSFTVGLTCDAGVAVNAVVTDQSDPTNTTTTLSLTGDSGAKGVGVQMFYNGTGPLSLGPDSSASGAVGQFFIQSTSAAESLSLPFQVRYVRTGELEPGTANALASITFSYQ